MRQFGDFWAYFALAAVCVFWGTTYLGIRMALEMFPPMLLLSIRFLFSGAILVGVFAATKSKIPRGRELLWTALFGTVTIGLGTGTLIWAEVMIPSGLASIFVTLSPFWMVGMEALVPGGERLRASVIGGMIIGLAGSILLVAPSAMETGLNGPVLKGFLLLQLGACGWATGSIFQRRHTTQAHPIVSGAVQQLATGLVFLLPALALQTKPLHWSTRGVSALFYLVTFGSIVGYSAYIYALSSLPVSVVTIYNYVNPVIALFLGWLFYREHIGVIEVLAMVIIFIGVAVVKRYGSSTRKRQTPAPPPAVSLDAGQRQTAV